MFKIIALNSTSNETLTDNCLNNILANIENFDYYQEKHWSPQLHFVNSINVREEIRYNVRIVSKTSEIFDKAQMLKHKDTDEGNIFIKNLTALVSEVRKVRGVFYERMEIFDFPIDKQELSIIMTSRLSSDQVVLVEDKAKPCLINTDRFCDGQVWRVFDFCNTTEEENYDELNETKRSQIKMTCFVVRKFQFYIYK